ncbi:MAG TPA: glycoside hydrolase family 97 catalytic domain-containing protein [Micromonosporaceae bacterium]|nr:glycoside hydrolase family 97 catalytic domain-containing protein [Micromonosporaceae bacterium]
MTSAVVAMQHAQAATIDPNGWYQLVNRNSGKALDVFERAVTDGADVIQWDAAAGAANQEWQFVSTGDGYHQIRARHSQQVLDVFGRSTADGADVVQWPANAGTNQQWSVVDTTGGFVKLVNRNSAHVLAVQDASTANGADVVQSADTGATSQQWQLVPVGGTTPTTPPASDASSWSVAQPGVAATGCDGVRATLTRTSAGALNLGATRNCATALEPAPVGLVTAAADLSTGLTFVSRTDRVISYSYTTITGKSRVRARTATESRIVFAKGSAQITVFLRVSPDGLAYRYELPTAGTITRERSSFQVPAGSPAYLSAWHDSYENLYRRTTAGAAATGDYIHPATFQVGSNWVTISESDVDGRYSGARLSHTTGTGRFTITLADASIAYPAGFVTSWRTAVIGTPATLVESTLNDDVAPPSRISDTSWIQPGISAWSWLDGTSTTQRNLTKQREYVDYTASQGWEYLILDDGWKSVTWVPELAAYARSKGVKLILWYAWTDLDTAAKRTTEFTRITGWGVSGVKLDFMESDSQALYRWYDAAAADAARFKLVVNFHGSTIPHGIQRTWPHVLTMEAVRGEEHTTRNIAHVVALPFTRNVVGSMDYTPMAFHRGVLPNSEAAEVGLGVVYESGLNVLGGSIAAYQARPQAQRFLRQLPAVWDETRLLAGDPANGATIARRNGDRWFVGAVYQGAARTLTVPTSFLGSGSWLVETITDGSGGLTRTSRTITAGTPLSVAIIANGGFAAQVCPATAGRTTCDR